MWDLLRISLPKIFKIDLINQASSLLEESISPVAEEESGSDSLVWKNQKKHFFVLSEAGKPIYTR